MFKVAHHRKTEDTVSVLQSRLVAAFQHTHRLEAELYALRTQIVNAEFILDSFGYRRCDAPSCNCNGYHRDLLKECP